MNKQFIVNRFNPGDLRKFFRLIVLILLVLSFAFSLNTDPALAQELHRLCRYDSRNHSVRLYL